MIPLNRLSLHAVIPILGVALCAASHAVADSAPAQTGFQRVGAWPYGPSLAVDVDASRNLVFLGAGGGVLILDGSDPTAPALLTEEIRTVGLISDFFYDADDQNLYIAGGEGGT
ncbi:MAG: hypothetical protein GF330_07845 [Candidatus Eisenbacteria bacterium]|nr:hypothetical protein [Candidatus Eisenbacteria bacterium]